MNREDLFLRIPLRGLAEPDVRDYIARAAGVEPSRELVRRIYEETEGNPFFLSEVVNLMAQEGTLTRDVGLRRRRSPRACARRWAAASTASPRSERAAHHARRRGPRVRPRAAARARRARRRAASLRLVEEALRGARARGDRARARTASRTR